MSRRRPLANAIFALIVIFSLPLGLYLQWGANRAVNNRFEANFQLLAEQRIAIIDRALRSPIENLNILGRFFAGSDEVTDEEFTTFIAAWRSTNRASDYAAWTPKGLNMHAPQLGYIRPSILEYLKTNIETKAIFRTDVTLENLPYIAILPPRGSFPACIVYIIKVETVQGPLVCIMATSDLSQRLEDSLALSERLGLPVTLFTVHDTEQQLLHFHEPRLDAAMGEPLFESPPKPRFTHTQVLHIEGETLLVRVDSSPAYERTHNEYMHYMVFPTIMLAFLLLGLAMRNLVSRLYKLENREEKTRQELEQFFALDLDLLAIADRQGVLQRVNPAWTRMLGFAKEDILGRSILDFVVAEDQAKTIHVLDKLGAKEEITGYTVRFNTKEGDRKILEWHASSADDVFFGAARDVTERETDEERLRQAIATRDTLLKELHHRVKNNLQIVSSLLNLSDCDSGDARICALIDDAQNRIRSMALVHEALYHSDDISGVRFEEYIGTLASSFACGGAGSHPIDIRICCDPLVFNLDLSIHCGILLNELLTNAVKHAFPECTETNQPVLAIRLRESGGTISLAVEDNGPGLPEGFSPQRDAHLGLRLAESLGSQLGGKGAAFTADRSEELGGARFTLVFTPDEGAWYRFQSTAEGDA